jgi:hypothetical protein
MGGPANKKVTFGNRPFLLKGFYIIKVGLKEAAERQVTPSEGFLP